MAHLGEIVQFLNTELDIAGFRDASLNGLQVQSQELHAPVERVAVAVDAGLSVCEEALSKKAQLLIVHHGLFWGECRPLVGVWAKKISCLLQGGCSLYAAHLPLDAHPVHGNAACIAQEIGLENCLPFGEYNGRPVGVRGSFSSARDMSFFIEYGRRIAGKDPLVLPFGPKEIRQVAIVTGSGSSVIGKAANEEVSGQTTEVPGGVDLFFTGEPKQDAFHSVKELGLNCVFAGHYATETFGVRAVGRLLERQFSVSSAFLDQPTGI